MMDTSIIPEYYKVNRYLLSSIGIWPYQTKRNRIFLSSFVTIVLLSFHVIQVSYFFTCKDRTCIVDGISTYMLNLILTINLCTFILKSIKIDTLLKSMIMEWKMLTYKTEEIEVMRKYARRGKWYSIIYAGYLYAALISMIIVSLRPKILNLIKPLNQSRPALVIFPIEWFVDIEEYYAYIYTHQSVGCLFGLMCMVSTDAMMFVYVEYAISIFTIICDRFERTLYQDSAMGFSSKYSEHIYQRIFTDTIQMHLRVTNFVKLFETTFSTAFVLILGLNTVSLSITLLKIAIFGVRSDIMISITLMFGQVVHLFLYCIEGQRIINNSTIITDKIYNGLWYTLPVKAQKMLLFALMRSNEYAYFSAGKIYIFSLQSFTTVLQTAMSYFTVLMSCA